MTEERFDELGRAFYTRVLTREELAELVAEAASRKENDLLQMFLCLSQYAAGNNEHVANLRAFHPHVGLRLVTWMNTPGVDKKLDEVREENCRKRDETLSRWGVVVAK